MGKKENFNFALFRACDARIENEIILFFFPFDAKLNSTKKKILIFNPACEMNEWKKSPPPKCNELQNPAHYEKSSLQRQNVVWQLRPSGQRWQHKKQQQQNFFEKLIGLIHKTWTLFIPFFSLPVPLTSSLVCHNKEKRRNGRQQKMKTMKKKYDELKIS